MVKLSDDAEPGERAVPVQRLEKGAAYEKNPYSVALHPLLYVPPFRLF